MEHIIIKVQLYSWNKSQNYSTISIKVNQFYHIITDMLINKNIQINVDMIIIPSIFASNSFWGQWQELVNN